jgi:hypothetical protein
MAKGKSRPQQWAEAVQRANELRGRVIDAAQQLAGAMQTLEDLRSGYEEWKDSLPENLQSSTLGEKLEEVCGIEFSEYSDADGVLCNWDSCVDAIDSAEGVDLPRGFGRD